VSDFPFLHRTNLRSFQCRYGDRLPVDRQKLHLERFAFIVDTYHRTDIARFQTLLWNALFQDHAIMLFDHMSWED